MAKLGEEADYYNQAGSNSKRNRNQSIHAEGLSELLGGFSQQAKSSVGLIVCGARIHARS